MPPDRWDWRPFGDVDVWSSAWSCAAGTAWKWHRCRTRCARYRADKPAPPADVAGPHLGLQALPRFRCDPLHHAAALRRRQQPRQAAFAIALPPALSGSHTIAQDLCGLTDAHDAPLLEKPKHPDPIGSALIPSRLLRGL